MRGIVVLMPIILSVVCFAMALDQSRSNRKKKFQQLNRENHEAVPVKQDMFQSYSSKNKECFEHEVKSSVADPKPKKRWNLWNEPSWDDELK